MVTSFTVAPRPCKAFSISLQAVTISAEACSNQGQYTPRVMPSKSARPTSMRLGAGWPSVFGSLGSDPAMTAYMRAASTALPARGPSWSLLQVSGVDPKELVRPKVPLIPTSPQKALGMRMDPPPSAPTAAGQSPAAADAAGPLEEPPV